MKPDQLAPLLYTAFTETEPEPLAATPKWEHLVPETRDRWVRMAIVLCRLMQRKWEVLSDNAVDRQVSDASLSLPRRRVGAPAKHR